MRRETSRFVVLICAALAGGCAMPPGPVALDTVPQFDLCLCATAEPARADRGQCTAELARRGLACDPDYWEAYWLRRKAR